MASAQSLTFFEFGPDYLHRLNTRDPDIEDHFVEYFTSLLQGKLRRNLAGLEQINDVRQETFVRVLTAIRTCGRIRQPERLGAFASTVCDNILYESFRSKKHYQPITDLPVEPFDPGRSPEAIFVGTETITALRLAMSRMPQREKAVLTAVFLEEKDKDEVCRQLGISRSNLRVLLHRAKKKLRELCRNTDVERRPHCCP